MQDYTTITEKAAEWNISLRHIQHLCRNGKIDGAIKRAGVWFIPGGTPSPAKNTKSDVAGFDFVGTKNRIFNNAVDLFLLYGFDNVSLNDIANSVGIRQSTIYNHFKSKQEILNTIYDFYCHYFLKDRPKLDDMESSLQNESFMDIINHIRYDFEEEHLKKMSDITKIVFQRIGIDERAKEIAKALIVDEGIQYVENVFNRLIELGRIKSLDTHKMAVFINSIRLFTLFHWIIDPSHDSMARLAEDEQGIYNCAAGFLEGLKPPVIDEQGKCVTSKNAAL